MRDMYDAESLNATESIKANKFLRTMASKLEPIIYSKPKAPDRDYDKKFNDAIQKTSDELLANYDQSHHKAMNAISVFFGNAQQKTIHHEIVLDIMNLVIERGIHNKNIGNQVLHNLVMTPSIFFDMYKKPFLPKNKDTFTLLNNLGPDGNRLINTFFYNSFVNSAHDSLHIDHRDLFDLVKYCANEFPKDKIFDFLVNPAENSIFNTFIWFSYPKKEKEVERDQLAFFAASTLKDFINSLPAADKLKLLFHPTIADGIPFFDLFFDYDMVNNPIPFESRIIIVNKIFSENGMAPISNEVQQLLKEGKSKEAREILSHSIPNAAITNKPITFLADAEKLQKLKEDNEVKLKPETRPDKKLK